MLWQSIRNRVCCIRLQQGGMHSGPALTPSGRYPEAGGVDIPEGIPEDIPEAFPECLSLSSALAEGVVLGARG